MRAITIIVLLWVIAVMATAGWRHVMRFASQYEVERTNRQYQQAIERENWK